MTLADFERGYSEGPEDDSGPTQDPRDHAMLEHLVEFETEMYRLDCYRRLRGCTTRQLERMMMNIHGEGWEDAL
jgi:hypothetical protein